VTLKLESAVAPFEFQSHVSESTTTSKSCDWTDGAQTCSFPQVSWQ